MEAASRAADNGEEGQADAEMQRRLAVQPPGGKRPLGRPLHLRVEIGLVPLVERSGGACPKRYAEDCGETDNERRHRRRSEKAAQGGEDHKAHHARLRQRVKVAPVGWKRGWFSHRHGGHAGRYKELVLRGKASAMELPC